MVAVPGRGGPDRPATGSGSSLGRSDRDRAYTLAVADSGNGRLLATGDDDTDDPQTLELWDTATGRFVRGRAAHPATAAAVTSQAGRRVVASAGLSPGENSCLWEPALGQELLRFDGRPSQANALAFAPDVSAPVACRHDGTVRVIRARQAGPVVVIYGQVHAVGASGVRGGRCQEWRNGRSLVRICDLPANPGLARVGGLGRMALALNRNVKI